MIILTGQTLTFERIELPRPWWASLLGRRRRFRYIVRDPRRGFIATGSTLQEACRLMLLLWRTWN